MSSEARAEQVEGEPTWLTKSSRLIPGEALAGYLSLQALSKSAQNPQNVDIVLALVFCVVTILLRSLGTQDPDASKPTRTVEWDAIIISTLSYIFLVYASGGQIFWHRPIPDQKLYGQIFSVALGILGPVIYRPSSRSNGGTPMPVLEDRFRLSDEEVSPGRMLAADRAWMASLDNLQLGEYSSYWIEMLRALPTVGAQGFKETIAVLDSGFLESEREFLNIDPSRSRDFTQEGLGDSFGHGTAISRLIHVVAPRATQVHLKIFNRQRTIAGSSFDQRVEVIRKAFEHLATLKISAVNLSWNHLTLLHDHDPDPRPQSFCHCPVCKIITEYVTASDVDVFVSEGNWEYTGVRQTRPEGSWSCPASAELVIPVTGLRDGKLTYSNNLDSTCGITAPSQIGIPERRFKFLGPLSKHLAPRVQVISGSSFAVPLVVATYAAVRSAFKSCRYDRFHLPRSSDGEGDKSSTSYDFPLELFFFPPDDPAERSRGVHTEWMVPAQNWRTRANRLAAEGDYTNAGQLLCLGADLLFVAFKRMENWKFNVPMADQMVSLYLEGIHYLLRSEIAITAPDSIEKTRQAIELAQHRGYDTAEAMKLLEQLAQYARDHAVAFLLR